MAGRARRRERKPGCLENREEHFQVELAGKSGEEVERGFGKGAGLLKWSFQKPPELLDDFWPSRARCYSVTLPGDMTAGFPSPRAIFSLAPPRPPSPQRPASSSASLGAPDPSTWHTAGLTYGCRGIE